jgi:hypothetical protein
MPVNPDEKNYLGLSGKGYFRLSQISGKALIIKVLSTYCPICQSTATAMAEVYHMIQNDPELRGQIKMIGIFAGNSAHEVDFFKESYRIPFPVFADEDFKIHKTLGEVRTPYFIGVVKDKLGNHKTVHTHSGGFTVAGEFLESVVQAFELNGKDPLGIRKKLTVSTKEKDSSD